MITIGVCDDSSLIRESICKICVEYETRIFRNSQELLTYEGDLLHLLFLDIELGENIKGTDLLGDLSSKDNVKNIVFISEYDQYMIRCFSNKTIGFVRKPFLEENIIHYLKQIERACNEEKKLLIRTDEKFFFLTVSDILYLEAESNYTKIHYVNMKSILVSGTLKAWTERLPQECICRVHRKYVINVLHIQKISAQKVICLGNVCLPVSRKYKNILIRYEKKF